MVWWSGGLVVWWFGGLVASLTGGEVAWCAGVVVSMCRALRLSDISGGSTHYLSAADVPCTFFRFTSYFTACCH